MNFQFSLKATGLVNRIKIARKSEISKESLEGFRAAMKYENPITKGPTIEIRTSKKSSPKVRRSTNYSWLNQFTGCLHCLSFPQEEVWWCILATLATSLLVVLCLLSMRLPKGTLRLSLISQGLQIVLRPVIAKPTTLPSGLDGLSFKMAFLTVLLGEFIIFSAYRCVCQFHCMCVFLNARTAVSFV